MSDFTTHQTLLKRLSAGSDPTAWNEFHNRYGVLIHSLAHRQGLQSADCDEVVQDVLTALSGAMPNFRYDPERGKFRAYLKTVTVRAIARRRNHSPLVVGNSERLDQAISDPGLDQAWEIEWRQYHLRLAMQTVEREFNATDRAAFDAYAIRGQDAQSTAGMLKISAERVYQAKSRILKRLGVLIADQVRDEG